MNLLLKMVSRVFDSLTSRLDIIDGNANVSKAAIRLRIPGYDFVIWVVLGAIVVR